MTVSVTAWVLLAAQLTNQADRRLEVYSRVPLLQCGVASLPQHDHPARIRSDQAPLVQVVAANGTVTTPRGNATAPPVSVTDLRVASGEIPAARYTVTDGERYRVLVYRNRCGETVRLVADMSNRADLLGDFGFVLLVIDAVAVALAAWLSSVVIGAGFRPLDRIVSAVEYVESTRDLDAAVPHDPGDPDETARIAHSVNSMLAALARAKLAQHQLVEDASHELGTPLTSLRTNVALLLRSELNAERKLSMRERRQLLVESDAQLKELSALLAEVVDLARDPRSAEDFDLLNLADVVHSAAARARSRNPKVGFDLSTRSAMIEGQPLMLERAVLNLLDNAAKWTRADQRVTVRIGVGDGHVSVCVADRGPGVPATDIDRVFQRFYRTVEARALPGSGLGLAIVRQTAEAHGGCAWLSRREGGGTEAWLRLPRPR
ncbi:MAG: HAMP domain-containing histidine kinase [Kutzneria sp.]|nr:HAMP domain-containing histidine kinase [Kutzneria sp.]